MNCLLGSNKVLSESTLLVPLGIKTIVAVASTINHEILSAPRMAQLSLSNGWSTSYFQPSGTNHINRVISSFSGKDLSDLIGQDVATYSNLENEQTIAVRPILRKLTKTYWRANANDLSDFEGVWKNWASVFEQRHECLGFRLYKGENCDYVAIGRWTKGHLLFDRALGNFENGVDIFATRLRAKPISYKLDFSISYMRKIYDSWRLPKQ